MIRSPPTRILPGPGDIHYHLERVFFRVAARYDDIIPESDDDDDYGEDLASINETEDSPTEDVHSELGSAVDLSSTCQQRSSTQTDGNASSAEDPSNYGHWGEEGSYETAIESVPGLSEDASPSAGTSHSGLTRAHHSLQDDRVSAYLSIGNIMASGAYPWPNHSLLPIHRVNPRVLMAVPEDGIWPTYKRTQLQAEASSLGSLFENLSLDTLPESTGSDQPNQSEKQRPCGQTKKDKSVIFDAKLDKYPTLLKDTSRPLHVTYPVQISSDYLDDMPGSIQDGRDVSQTDIPTDNPPLQKAGPDDTESESNSTRSSMASQNKGRRTRKSGNAAPKPAVKRGRKPRNGQAPVQKTYGGKKGSCSRTANASQTASRSVSRSSDVGTDSQARDDQPEVSTEITTQNDVDAQQDLPTSQTQETAQDQVTSMEGQQSTTVSSTLGHPVDYTDSHLAPMTSTNSKTAMSSMAPANVTLEVSGIFRNHVNKMIAGLDDEDDTADDFGLGEIRRRPMGAWYD